MARQDPRAWAGWLAKSLAGVLLGFVLALQASTVFVRLATGDMAPPALAQLAMCMVPPVWLAVASVCFVFDTGLRAWLWLGGACLAMALLVQAVNLAA
jgi:hypothetical protein